MSKKRNLKMWGVMAVFLLAVLPGSVWATGIQNALDFDGTDDRVKIPDDPSLDLTSAITIEAWINPAAYHNWDRIVAKPWASAQSPWNVWSLIFNNNPIPKGRFEISVGATQYGANSESTVPLNQWTHLAGSYDGETIRIFFNGWEEANNPSPSGDINTNNMAVYIGYNIYFSSELFEGVIDEVRIWDVALDETTIQNWMYREVENSHANYANLVSYWKMNEGTGQTVADSKGSNDGILGESSTSGMDDPTWVPSTAPVLPDLLIPANHATDVSVDTNLIWPRGDYCIQDEVYFGTDPCMANLPKIATLSSIQPALVDFTEDLVASTTYHWYVVETDGNLVKHTPDDSWSFTTVLGEAQPDYPFDGAVIPGDTDTPSGNIWTTLDFLPGPTAAKHTGYCSENRDDVLLRLQDANLGPPPNPTAPNRYYVGLPAVPPYIDSLERGKAYYWCVDETDALDNTFPGDIWKFGIQGFKAFDPNPVDGDSLINTDVLLSWLIGVEVSEHDVYIGTNWDDVNDADEFDTTGIYKDFVVNPQYQCTGLEFLTTYYWRVDEVIDRIFPGTGTIYTGDVWCFTTVPEGVGQITEDLWWNLTTSDSPNRDSLQWLYGDPDFPGQPDETRMLNSFDSGADLGNDYGGMIHGWLHIIESGNYTFWLCADNNAELFLSTDETPANMQLIANESGSRGPLTWGFGGEEESVSIPLVGGRKYYIRACWKEAGGGDQCQVAWQGPDQPLAPVNGSAAAVIPGSRLSPYQQLWAHDPDPRDGQVSVPTLYTLRWGAGDHAAQHDVYLGTDKATVTNATTSSTGIYQGRIGPNSLGPVLLNAATFYYWRVDEVNLAGPDPYLWKGETWTFRTEGAAGGLLGLYYHWDGFLPNDPLGPDNAFQVFVMSRIDPEVNFNWGTGSPDPNVNVEDFGCKWVGHVECPVDANYTFYTTTDDGARLFIDGQQLPLVNPAAPQNDSWRQQGDTEYGASIVLSAGLHDIEMHMYERGGGATAQLRWSSIPTNPLDDPIYKQIIPSVWLWPSLFASGPRPPDGATIDDRTPALEWTAGVYAVYHELYFSENFDNVNDRNPLVRQILIDPCRPYPALPPLQLGETYYWLVDEVKSSPPGRWNARNVWSFTISECLSLDNMEDYDDRDDIRGVWRDGNAAVVWAGTYPYLYLVQGGSSGSNLNVSTAVGSPYSGATGPIPPTPFNYEAMVLRYDNDGWTYTYTGLPGDEKWVYDAPYYSEIEANTVGNNSLGVGQTWYSEGIKSLSLWFQGHPISDGYYDATAWPAYTINGRGRDIWGRHDEFYFLSQYPFIGAGSVQARVVSMDDTNPWAKAGVMIREKRTPYSKFAAVFMTPGRGVSFQYRDSEDGPATEVTKPGVSAPQYVRLVRNIDGSFEAKHSDNPFVWEDVNAPGQAPVFPEIAMGTINDPNIYVGSAVSSHNANQICAADFNDLLISPLPTNWIYGNIGTNDPEQLYVALSDGVTTAVVNHPNPNAATLTSWQEWNIALSDFTTVNLDGIKKIYIGLGDRDNPVYGGSGAVYIDDIRLYKPGPVFVDAWATGNNNGRSWADAYNYLQDALNRALSGDEIFVAQGTYKPDEDTANPGGTGVRGATFQLENGVAIYGGFPSGGGAWEDRDPAAYETILSGDLAGNDVGFTNNGENSYHVVTGSGTDPYAVLDGFTITAGNAANSGGGVFNSGGLYMMVNCRLIGNSASLAGGAVYNENHASPLYVSCDFIGNSASQRGGGGMFNDFYSSPAVINCTFTGNESLTGFGGGVYNYNNSSPWVINCAFSGNFAYYTGGMRNFGSSPTVKNCILWGNVGLYNPPGESSQIETVGGVATIHFCCVQGWTGSLGGVGNIGDDPLFRDADGPDDIFGTEDDNLRLSAGSPCIDVGDNMAVFVYRTDLDGHPRIIDGDCNGTEIVDMGAYEFNYAYLGDFDYNCKVNFGDFAILALAWLTEPGQTGWNPVCDISIPADSYIDWDDLDILSNSWLAGL